MDKRVDDGQEGRIMDKRVDDGQEGRIMDKRVDDGQEGRMIDKKEHKERMIGNRETLSACLVVSFKYVSFFSHFLPGACGIV